jgi:hypothetical protein
MLALLGLFPASSSAVTGWQIDEVDRDFPGEPVRIYHAGTAARIENLVVGLSFVLDLDKGTVFALDAENKRYAGGTVAEITAELDRHMAARRKARGIDAPGEKAAAIMAELRVEKLAEEGTIAGHRASGYRVFLGDLLVEEIWFSAAVDAATTGAGGVLYEMVESVTGGEGGDNEEFPPVYEKETAYRSLLSEGYPLKRIRYFLDVESVTEVTEARRRDLAREIFEVPADFVKVDYLTLFSGRK